MIIKNLSGTILMVLLVLSCVLGSYAAYIAMFASLAGSFLLINTRTVGYFIGQTWLRMWVAAFALIAIAFVVSAETIHDGLYAFDFAQLLLALPVAMIFFPQAHGKAIQIIALLSFAGTMVAFALAAYSTYFLHVGRPSGLEMSTIHFAYFSLILGFLSLSGFFAGNARPPLILLIGPVVGFGSALMTGTRGGVVVLGAASLVLLVFFLRAQGLTWRTKILCTLGFPATILLTLYGAYMVGISRVLTSLLGVAQAIQTDGVVDTSTAYRLEHFSAGIKAFWDAPFFGHGWTNQIASALPYMSDFGRSGYASEKWAYLHNEALSLASSAGLLGIIAYLLILGAPIVGVWQSARDSQFIARAYAMCILVAGIWAGGLSEVLFKYELPKTFFVFIAVALLIYCRDETPNLAEDSLP